MMNVSLRGTSYLSARHTSIAVLGLALVVRVGVLVAKPELLETDPDGYVALAEGLRDGRGFVASGSATAFRPPLYPLLLAPAIGVLGRTLGIAVVQLLAGLAVVRGTEVLGRRWGLGRGAIVAAVVVAVEPLLVLYTAHPMTEVVFAALVVGLLLAIDLVRSRPTALGAFVVGVAFGLTALCRPTIWAFGALAVLALLARRPRGWPDVRRAAAVLGGVSLVVLPWLVRNTVVLGRPVVMTTHGGYTLLLANNPTFYDEVVRQPWGTVWEGESLTRWQVSLEREMAAAEPPVHGELARDRWHRDRAIACVRNDPSGFAAATWLRVRRFWNPVPLTATLPRLVVWAVGAFEVTLFLLAIVGLVRVVRTDLARWWPCLLVVLSLTAVHAVYWSNARMRAPVVPVLALLAANAVRRTPPADAPGTTPDDREAP